MESAQLPGPQPNAYAAVTTIIHSLHKLHLQAVALRSPSLEMEREWGASPRQWGPEKRVRPLLRREGAPRLLG